MEQLRNIRAYLRAAVRARVRNELGASLVEYALLVGLIGVVCFAAITFIGDNTNTSLSRAGGSLNK